jgi:hypothetical protein
MTSTIPLRLGIGALTLFLAAGCSMSTEDAAPAYVGKVTGTDAVVAAVSDGARVQLYVCGGDSTFETLTHWFQGPVGADGTFSIQSGDLTAQGDITSGEGGVTTKDGTVLSWKLAPAAAEMHGLYATMDGSCRTGAVVGDFDGDGVTDLQGVWCDGEGKYAQVTPLMPMVVTERGIGVKVLVTPPKDLYVDRVRAP